MTLYFESLLTGGEDGAGPADFLPLPAGEPAGGSGTADDPAISEGSLEVSLKPGTPFVLPIAAWASADYVSVGIGLIDNGDGTSSDPELGAGVFDASEFEIKLDGEVILSKSAGDGNLSHYVSPQAFADPIVFDGFGTFLSIEGFIFVMLPWKARAGTPLDPHHRGVRPWFSVRQHMDDLGREVTV